SFSCNHMPTPEFYTLSLHDALPIYRTQEKPAPIPYPIHLGAALGQRANGQIHPNAFVEWSAENSFEKCRTHPHPHPPAPSSARRDRKSTRLNSSHVAISYAVFCLKK